jgi:hypothetical protein
MVQAKKSNAKPVKLATAKPKAAQPAAEPRLAAVAQKGAEPITQQTEKVQAMSREAIETINKSTDKAARSMGEAFAINQEQVEALVESGKIAGDVSRDLQETLVSEMNEVFAEQVELSKDLLACRTLNDVVEIQNRALQSNLSRFFNTSARITDAWFKITTEATEPFNAQATQLSKHVKKVFTS